MHVVLYRGVEFLVVDTAYFFVALSLRGMNMGTFIQYSINAISYILGHLDSIESA